MSTENEIIENEEEVETLPEDEEQAQWDRDYEEAVAKLNADEQPAQDSEDIEEEPAAEEEPGEEEQPGEEDSLKPGETKEEEQAPEMVEITWRGKPVMITKEQERQLAQQGYDYTYKTQELAKSRKEHEAELKLLEEVKKGDPKALARLAKQAGVDPIDLLDIDLDDEQGTPEQPQAAQDEPFVSPQVAALLGEVQKDPELNQKMVEVQDYLPSGVIDVMAKDPETFYAVVNEVRSGDADIVLPQVNAQLASLPELDRALVMNNPDQFAQFYMSVKQSMIEAQQSQTKQPQQRRQPNPNRAAAAVSRSGGQRGNAEDTSLSNGLLSDDAYEKIKKKLENSQ